MLLHIYWSFEYFHHVEVAGCFQDPTGMIRWFGESRRVIFCCCCCLFVFREGVERDSEK